MMKATKLDEQEQEQGSSRAGAVAGLERAEVRTSRGRVEVETGQEQGRRMV